MNCRGNPLRWCRPRKGGVAKRASSLFVVLALASGAAAAQWYDWTSIGTARAACSPSTPQARLYGSQLSTLAAYGVDGYVQYAPGILIDPMCQKIANYLNVMPSNSGSITQWIQVGVRIGVKQVNVDWDSTYQVYVESVNACFGYSRTVFGQPSGTNRAYYINYTGSQTWSCTPTQYEYAVRRDDWYNPPTSYRYISVPSPQWHASSETGSNQNPPNFPWLGTVSFGNPSDSLANGLHWYNTAGGGTWNEWNSAATTRASSGRVYCSQVAYRAFQVKNTSC